MKNIAKFFGKDRRGGGAGKKGKSVAGRGGANRNLLQKKAPSAGK